MHGYSSQEPEQNSKPNTLDEEIYIFPTSFSQQRLWFLDQFEPGSPFYNIFSAVRIKGLLKLDALDRCVQEIVRRHESLRTTFSVSEDVPVQLIHPSMIIPLDKINLQSLDSGRKEKEVIHLATNEARKPFNLSEGPLLRTTLLILSDREYVFMFSMHHIISDGWSMGVFLREFTLLYDSFSRNQSSPLPELQIQYADYTLWQREYLKDEILEKQLHYWKKQLGDSDEALELPTDHPRPTVQTSNGANLTRQISKDLSEAVNRLSRQEDSTLFITLLTTFQILLYRYTGQEDISVGTPIANRTQVDTENLIGFLMNTLVMRTQMRGNPTFRELLRQVKEIALGAYAHQDLPFEKLVEELKPDRDMSHTPLFQVMFVLQNTPVNVETRLKDLTLSSINVDAGTSTFDLTLMIVEEQGDLLVSVEYNTDIFEASSIERLLNHYENLLRSIIKDPDQRISAIQLSSEKELRKVIQEWNATEVDIGSERCIHRLVEAQIEKTPDAVAVVYDEDQLTYGELNRRANQVANYLRKMNIGPENLIGISVKRSLDTIIGILGILKAGGTYVPLDPNYPQERLSFIIKDAGLKVIITQQHLFDKFAQHGIKIICIDKNWSEIAKEKYRNSASVVSPENPAYLIYTSGSTGTPKGVLITHHAVVNHNLSSILQFKLQPEDKVLQFATINFDAAVEEIFPTLMVGAKLILRNDDMLISIDDFMALIEREQLSVLDLPTAYWHEWVADLATNDNTISNSIRLVILGGDKASPERFLRWNRFADKSIRLLNTYGPTETTIVSTVFEPDPSTQIKNELFELPIGRPIFNTRIYILDKDLQSTPIGIPGELCIGGDGVARGYLDRPDMTAEKFIPDPFDPKEGSRIYRTGDLARFLPDGNIQFLGRVDHQLKIRGFRVELGEIESILNTHPALKEVVIDAKSDVSGEKRLVAYCVPHTKQSSSSDERRSHVRVQFPPGSSILFQDDSKIDNTPENFSIGGFSTVTKAFDWKKDQTLNIQFKIPGRDGKLQFQGDIRWSKDDRIGIRFRTISSEQKSILENLIDEMLDERNVTVGELREFLSSKLPEYMVPSAFIILEAIPKTLSGKVDRKALPEPAQIRPDLEQEYVAARTPVEELLTNIWNRLLGYEKIGVHDNFFEIGGHSLLATQLVSRIRDTFQIEMPLRNIFESPTIADLAKRIEGGKLTEKHLVAPPIQNVSRAGVLPLSFAQQRLWFLDQLEPGSAFYNIPMVFRIVGKLKIKVLQKSINEIVRRHEILRTTYSNRKGMPVQLIIPEMVIDLPVTDLLSIPNNERDNEALRIANQEAKRPFDLENGPPLRTKLLRVDDEDYIILLTMHHIASDDWSTNILIHEVAALYQAFSRNKPSPMPELSIQYADFAHWQQKWLQGEVLETQLSYWNQQLENIPQILELPTDRPRPPVQTFNGDYISFELPESVSKKLEELTAKESATLFMTLLAAFKILLYRYSAQTDISVGIPIANRGSAEIEGLIGFFVNTLVMRTDLSNNPSFRKVLQRVREVALGAYAHQDIPFEMLVEKVQADRDLSYSPLFQVAFTFQAAPVHTQQTYEFPDLKMSPLDAHSGTAKFDLTLFMVKESNQFTGIIEYNTDLFDKSTIKRMTKNFNTLVKNMADSPDIGINDIAILDDSEEAQLLTSWNATQSIFPKDFCVHQLVEHQAELRPDAIAVNCGQVVLTYRELNQRANQLAQHLQKIGVGPEGVVGVCMDRSTEMVVGLLGVLKTGGAYLPLDPTYPDERLSFLIEDANIVALLTQSNLSDRFLNKGFKIICMDTDRKAILQEAFDNLVNIATVENSAYIIYTSGSTGLPKGVQITHSSLLNLIHWHQAEFGVTPDDRATQVAGPGFDASVWEIWPYLTNGASLHIPDEETRTTPQKLRDWLVANNISISFLPTPLAESIISMEWPEKIPLRLLLTGGDKLNHYPSLSLPFGLINNYGPTENTVVTTSGWVAPGEEKVMSPSIGRPIANTQVYLLDSKLNPVPIGVSGELHIGGDSLARCYVNRADQTAEKFIPNPFSKQNGDRLYKTGDLARYLPDGSIEFLGRVDFQVKIRGFRIELGEIEVILNQHPQVREGVVIAREENLGDRRLIAYFTGKNQDTPVIRDLRSFLSEHLPEYMVPSAFIRMENLPLTPNGKIDRRALPAPDKFLVETGISFVAPRTPIEEILATIWSEVLGVEKIGIYDNFFELGGHSLLATQLVSRMRESFQTEVPLRFIFESPTLGGLAAQLERIHKLTSGTPLPPIEPESSEDDIPLSFAQQRLWFLDHLEPNSPSYNLPMAIRLEGTLAVPVLDKSLNEIIRRHESLRTTFFIKNGKPLQKIHQHATHELKKIDLQSLTDKDRNAETYKIATQEAQKPFNLLEGPLFRTTLLLLGDGDYVLLLTMHHIVSDGWSMAIFINEIAVIYNAFLKGEPSPLPDLKIQYKDFAVWQRKYMQGETLEEQFSYWEQQLGDSSHFLELPTDRPRPAVQTMRGANISMNFPKSVVDALINLSNDLGVTLFITLMAAFKTLLFRYTGQIDISVGTPVANRTRMEIENLIGFFVNTLVMRTKFSENISFKKLLEIEREVALGAYAYQELPFEMLVDKLQPERDLSYNPLFQVMFTLQNAQEGDIELPALKMSPLDIEAGTAKFDLTLSLAEGAEGFGVNVEYNTDLFRASTIKRMMKHYEILLENIVKNPDEIISDISILPQAERRQILNVWNNNFFDYPKENFVHQLFDAQVEQRPDAVALVFEQEILTYQELDRRANKLGRYLQKKGVGPEVIVAVCFEQAHEMVISLLSILKVGGAYLPVDPTYPSERIAFMLDDAKVPILITQKQLQAKFSSVDVEVVYMDSDWETISQESQEKISSSISRENLAYLIYTSGSTGIPKGVLITHEGLLNLIYWHHQAFEISPTDRATKFARPGFDASVWEIWPYLTRGSSLHIPNDDIRSSPSEMHDWLILKAITICFLPTPMTENVLSLDWSNNLCLRILLTGGDKLHQYPPSSLSFELVNNYGPTEYSVVTTSGSIPPNSQEDTAPSIGHPIANTQVYILDSYLQPVPIGIPGELYIGGSGLARCYLNRPDQTAEKFIPNPFDTKSGSRLYKTGDLVRYLPDGSIDFIGRVDFQVKIHGFRIETGEIEAVLNQHPVIHECVVIDREDKPGDKHLVAYYIPSDQKSSKFYEFPALFLSQKIIGLPEYDELIKHRSSRIGHHPFQKTPSGSELSLSSAQKRIWFLNQSFPDSHLYNLQSSIRLKRVLKIWLLEQSLNEIIHRHQVLRTVFKTSDGLVIPEIAPELVISISLIDLEVLAEPDREIEASRIAHQNAVRPFNLGTGPLLRTTLLRMGNEDWLLLITMHSIISDGWSFKILMQELTALYEANLKGEASPLNDLNFQYADFARWQLNRFKSEALQRHLRYWKARLANGSSVLALPADRQRPEIPTYEYSMQSFRIPDEISRELKELSGREGVTLFMTLLAAFKTLLYRYSGEEDIFVGIPIDNRNWDEVKGLIGLFVNILVLRTDLSGSPSFQKLLKRVKKELLSAYDHKDVPIEIILDQLQLEWDTSYHPLFQVMFVMQCGEIGEIKPEELTIGPKALDNDNINLDLICVVREDSDGISGQIEYNTDLFDGTTIERFLNHFQILLEGIVTTPHLPISVLPILSDKELNEGLLAGPELPVDFPESECLHRLFEGQVQVSPDAIAVVLGDDQITYSELNHRGNQLAHYLQKLGVGPEVLVGMWMERSIEMLIGIVGILKAGGAYVPMDLVYPADRVSFMLEDSQAPVILTQQRLVENLPASAVQVVCIDSDWDLICQEPEGDLDIGVMPSNLIYVIYTSGSTGKPKGVLVTHENVDRLFKSTQSWYHFTRDDVWTLFHSYAFDFSVWEIWGALLYGGKVVVVPYEMSRFPEAFYELLVQERVTVLNQTPSAFRQLIQAEEVLGFSNDLVLRLVIFGGEALELQSLRPWFDRHGDVTPQLVNMYGITETTVHVTYRPITITDIEEERGSVIGVPLPDLKVYVLDGHLRPVPIGVSGELYVGGGGVWRGYLNNPEISSERFIPDPFSQESGARLYRTGDLGRCLSYGEIEYLGRVDYQVQVRGFRVELGEIESNLTSHSHIEESVVIAREDHSGHERLVAYVVPTRERAPAISELRQYLKTKLPDYMIPSVFMVLDKLPLTPHGKVDRKALPIPDWKIEREKPTDENELRNYIKEKLPEYMLPRAFVMLDKFPLTPNGKIDRRALPRPDERRIHLEEDYVAPTTDEERILSEIWSQVLGIDRVGIYDNFFELGGDSILSIQVISQANQQGLRINVKQLFQNPTIVGLADVADSVGSITSEQEIVSGSLPLTPIQHWFFENHPLAPHHFNLSALLEVFPSLNFNLIKQTVWHLLVHHDALRLTFQNSTSGWRQQIASLEEIELPVFYVDLSNMNYTEQKIAIKHEASDLQASFNLARAPLMRIAYFNLGSQKSDRLLIIFHHLVTDGVSWRILMEDIFSIYKQISDGKNIQFPPKTTSFQRWSKQLSEYAQSTEIQKEFVYWMKIGKKEFTPLPLDFPFGDNTYSSMELVQTSLNVKETQTILKGNPQYSLQINDILLTALVKSFFKLTGKRDILIEMEGHGREYIREDVDVSRTSGWFTSAFPVYLDLTGAMGLEEELELIKNQLQNIPNHGIGYGLLRYLTNDVRVRESLKKLPHPEVNFNYLGQFGQMSRKKQFSQFLKKREFKIQPAPESDKKAEQSPISIRTSLLYIVGSVTGKKLHVVWGYSKELHKRRTIENLATDYIKELKNIIAFFH